MTIGSQIAAEPLIEPSENVPDGDFVAEADLSADLPVGRFGNRELSWLAFNERVLALADDEAQPLLERVKYLAIFASNLDEFYMVRVAGLKRRADMGLQVPSADGLSPREVLAALGSRIGELVERHAKCFRDVVEPALHEQGIHIRRWDALDNEEKARLGEYFRSQVFPVLTPLAVDPAHPFPYISGQSLNLAVLVRDLEGGSQRFARVKVPNNVSRFIVVSQSAVETEYLPLEDLIAEHLSMLFPGMDVVEHHLFRVTRNADFEVEEDRDEDLLQALERELMRRRFGPAVRLEVTDDIDDEVVDLLVSEIDVDRDDVLHVPGLLDLSALWQVYELDRPNAEGQAVRPGHPPALRRGRGPEVGVLDAARRGRARAPPVRVLRHQRAAVHRAGSGRPARPRDQADAVPHLRRLAHRRCPHRRGARPASRSSPSSRSRPASTSRPTSSGHVRSSARAAMSSTASSG